MKTRTLAAAAVAVLSIGTSALADLNATDMTVTITHSGPAGGIVGPAVVNHTYGTPSIFSNMFFGTFTVSQPAIMPGGYDNALLIDFTSFNYSGFAGYAGTISVTGIDETVAPGSLALLVGATDMGFAKSSGADSFTGSWNTTDLLNGNPAAPQVLVVWNSAVVPAPGALALIGLAGAVASPRRRRHA
jgi:hypothetical protein